MIPVYIIAPLSILILFIVFLYLTVSFLNNKQKISLTNKHVMITGGSKGIGLAIAEKCLQEGAFVTILARNEELLQNACADLKRLTGCEDKKISYISIDVSNDSMDLENKIDEVVKKLGNVDILVNCAGTSLNKTFNNTKIEEFKRMMDINFIGSLTVTKKVLHNMKKNNFGHIVFFSSIAGQMGLYGYSAYSASKFALRGLAESLFLELSSFNIGITVVYPPDTDTPGFREENLSKLEATKLISQSGGIFSPDYVAKCTINSIKDRRFNCPIGIDGSMISYLTSGMSTPYSLREILLECLSIGPLRIISMFFLLKFKKIILSIEKKQ